MNWGIIGAIAAVIGVGIAGIGLLFQTGVLGGESLEIISANPKEIIVSESIQQLNIAGKEFNQNTVVTLESDEFSAIRLDTAVINGEQIVASVPQSKILPVLGGRTTRIASVCVSDGDGEPQCLKRVLTLIRSAAAVSVPTGAMAIFTPVPIPTAVPILPTPIPTVLAPNPQPTVVPDAFPLPTVEFPPEPTPVPVDMNVVFVFDEFRGAEIIAPIGSLVTAEVTLLAREDIAGGVNIEVRKDIPDFIDETETYCPSPIGEIPVNISKGNSVTIPCSFNLNYPVGANIRQWFVEVRWEQVIIYNTVDSVRPNVEVWPRPTPTATLTP